jgi:hypothetical protein
MKLIGLMSLKIYENEVRDIFKKHHVKIYSEVEISGHTGETLKQYGWWSTSMAEDNIYSVLYFAIVNKELADELLDDVVEIQKNHPDNHPPRAFVVNVERMV